MTAPTPPPILSVRGATRRYGAMTAVAEASLDLEEGRITALLGPSGSGKSTLLRLIAGLEPLDAGEVRAGDRLLSGPGVTTPPEARGVGLVFQDYALFPHLSVVGNVEFGLRRLPRAERRARALAALERVRLADRARDWPHRLSGGEQQRVALARSLVREPAAILLDEPFSGLDAHLKAEVREDLLATLRTAGAAVLIVTHDATEALGMADRLVLMEAGRVIQADAPGPCYARPASAAAARLLGPVNVAPVEVRGGMAETPWGLVPAPGLADGPADLLLRPQHLSIQAGGALAEVTDVRFGGHASDVSARLGDLRVVMQVAAPPPGVGETLPIAAALDQACVVPR